MHQSVKPAPLQISITSTLTVQTSIVFSTALTITTSIEYQTQSQAVLSVFAFQSTFVFRSFSIFSIHVKFTAFGGVRSDQRAVATLELIMNSNSEHNSDLEQLEKDVSAALEEISVKQISEARENGNKVVSESVWQSTPKPK